MEVEKVTAQPDESFLKSKGAKKRKGPSGSDQEEEWIRQFDLLDAALRCSICHDCIDTPLLVRTCGHSFCAGCIRQNLEFQGKKSGSSCCPTCRKQCDTRDLVVNTMLRGVVERYDGVLKLFKGKDGGKADGLVDLIRSNLNEAKNQRTREKIRMHVDKNRNGDKAHLHGDSNNAARCNGNAVGTFSGQDGPRRNPPRRSKAWRLKGKMEKDVDAEIEILESDTEEAGPSTKENCLSNRSDFSDEEVPSDGGESSDEEFAPETDVDRGTKTKGNGNATKKKKKKQTSTINNNESSKAAGSKFVHCPICGKSVSEFFVNSHIDQCLVNADRQNANTTTEAGAKTGHPSTENKELESKKNTDEDWAPLPVPPKFIGNLVTEKMIRASLRKYGVATDGKKPELIDRYNKFRLEIEIANDREEKTTYDKIASRISQKERVKAAASLLNKPVSSSSKRQMNDSRMTLTGMNQQPVQTNILSQGQTKTDVLDFDLSKISHPREILLHGASFEHLIQVTLLRDRFRKKQREEANQDQPCANIDTHLLDQQPKQHDEKQSTIPNTRSLEASKLEQELQDVEEIILNSENEDDIW